MTEYKVTGTELTDLAEKIRSKGKTEQSLVWPDGFKTAINDLVTDQTAVTSIDFSNLENGTFTETLENGQVIEYTVTQNEDGVVESISNGEFTAGVSGLAPDGSEESSGVALNIHYGDTEPEKIDGIWVKSDQPNKLVMTPDFTADSEILQSVSEALPTTTTGIAAAAVGTKVYLFGGYGSSFLNTINVFDTTTETISTLPVTLPTAATGIVAAAVGTKVYLFGGYTGSYLNTINVFDTESETISTLSATLPTPANTMAFATVGTKVYLFGGSKDGANPLDTINVFDTESRTIRTLSATIPTAATGIAAAAVGTKVYLFGGNIAGGNALNTINVFDTEGETISTLSATLPTAGGRMPAAAIGNKVYLFGGTNGSYLDTVSVFNSESETISTLSATLPTKSYSIAAAVVGTKVYLFGGYKVGGSLGTINAFIAAATLTAGEMVLVTTLTGGLTNLIATDAVTVKVGVTAAWLGDENNAAQPVEAAIAVDGEWVSI